MDRNTVINFNLAYAAEPTEAEKQFVNELLLLWGKLEPAAGKNPSILRRGVLFGMALQKHIAAGEITVRAAKPKRQGKNPQEPAENGRQNG